MNFLLRTASSLDIILFPDLPLPFALAFGFFLCFIFKRIYFKELLLLFITRPSRRRQPSLKMGLSLFFSCLFFVFFFCRCSFYGVTDFVTCVVQPSYVTVFAFNFTDNGYFNPRHKAVESLTHVHRFSVD